MRTSKANPADQPAPEPDRERAEKWLSGSPLYGPAKSLTNEFAAIRKQALSELKPWLQHKENCGWNHAQCTHGCRCGLANQLRSMADKP